MSLISGLEHFVRDTEPMAAHTWLRVGGPVEYFAEPTTVEELAMLSEITASLVALAERPMTPALSEEEIVMRAPFCVRPSVADHP